MSVIIVGLNRIKIRLKEVDNNIKNVEKELVKIASDVRKDIRVQSRKGIDLNGNEFEEYLNEEYIQHKIENAYSAFKTSDVNLSFTGHMLSFGMSVRKIKNGAKVYFNNKADELKAKKINFGIGQPVREFFGISERMMNKIKPRLNKIWRLK